MLGKKQFDFGLCCELEKYVRTHFTQLSASAFHVYHLGLSFLERTLSIGVGGRIVVPSDKWAEASGVTSKTVGKALRELATLGLVEFVPGNSAKRICNTVRRRLISELQHAIEPEILHVTLPQIAETIAERLGRIFIIWKGERVTPSYPVAKTARIYMRNPNLQCSPEHERFSNLMANVPPGWILIANSTPVK